MSAKSINFTMNYYALKTFGRQQYSNVWAALSELVANGFDAKAKNVYLYINMEDKKKSVVEIIDDGEGMDETDLETKYAIIGRNRRNENPEDKAAGRKGIGKLAALYLSDEYQIISIKNNNTTAWSVNVGGKSDTDIPRLDAVDIGTTKPVCVEVWDPETRTQGTMIRLLDVDLTRIGDRAIEALKKRMSNYFLFDSLNSALHLCIVSGSNDKIVFEKVQKQIAFNNMYYIYYSDISFIEKPEKKLTLEFQDKMRRKKVLVTDRIIEGLPSELTDIYTGKKVSVSGMGTFYGKTVPYSLTGWIGVHSSIETKTAVNNDERFVRNNYYNPNKIRVYVRNKLANENILDRLGLVGTYANYIEGEVSFDILDENDFEDIATANRQDFSVIDERVSLLIGILRGICRQLLTRRQELADKMNAEKKKIDDDIQSKQKTEFAGETRKDLVSAGISDDKANELSVVISNKLKGEFDLKTNYRVFLSHSKKDRIFTDFVANYLKFRGFRWDREVDKTDIFYSSDGTDIEDTTPLANIIKNMILDSNTDILFLTSNQFLKSQYCLFEGGAAWATRAILDYCVIALDYESIPKFLTNQKSEFSFDTKTRESFLLDEQNYTNIVTILNRLIAHLNKNKEKSGEPIVSKIQKPEFDDLVEMKAKSKHIEDYMDPDVYLYWKTYVIDRLDDYYKTLN